MRNPNRRLLRLLCAAVSKATCFARRRRRSRSAGRPPRHSAPARISGWASNTSLMGVDHLLFVLGLVLIVSDRWMLVKTIPSFTVAHSITLAIATLGYASAPHPPLNAAIALSILFLGPEIVRVWRGETRFTIRTRGWWRSLSACSTARLCERPQRHGAAEGRDPARAAPVQCRRRAGPVRLRAAGAPARALLPDARDPLAAPPRGAAGLRRGLIGSVLDDPRALVLVGALR